MHAHHVAGVPLDLIGFFTLGFLGAFGHCLGMCSPFVMLVSRRETDRGGSPAVAQAWYAAGRVLTYSALGAIAGALGQAIGRAGLLVGIQRGAGLLAGATLTLWALAALVGTGSRWQFRGFSRVLTRLAARTPGHPFLLGLLLGLLPCGLLYSAVVAAMTRGGVMEGAAAMALFAAGTVPMMAAVAAADSLVARSRPLINGTAQVFVLLMGAWFLWRALAGSML